MSTNELQKLLPLHSTNYILYVLLDITFFIQLCVSFLWNEQTNVLIDFYEFKVEYVDLKVQFK